MSYTPPDGYALSEDGTYTYTATAIIYAYNYDIKYGDAINSFSLGASAPIEREFKYEKIESKVNVKFDCSHDIIMNGKEYHPYNSPAVIGTIDLESGDGNSINILIGLDSNHYIGAFDISFDSCTISNTKIYLSVNSQLYQVNVSSESKRCYISKYENRFHDDGYMYTTGGFDYTFNSTDWDSNCLFTKRNIKDDFGEWIPSETRMRYVVKFTLYNNYYQQDCTLYVDINTN